MRKLSILPVVLLAGACAPDEVFVEDRTEAQEDMPAWEQNQPPRDQTHDQPADDDWTWLPPSGRPYTPPSPPMLWPPRLPDVPLNLEQILGQTLYFDTNLSTPLGQSCAVCHMPSVGWTGPDEIINATGAVYEGAVESRFGNRKPPSAAYATSAPLFQLEDMNGEELFLGGNFWDGRATGFELGNAAADQAQGPPLNPLEQNNPSVEVVCIRIRNSDFALHWTDRTYEELFAEVYGLDSLDCENNAQQIFDLFAIAIATWEDSCQVNQYSSKYDAFLLGRAELTPMEKRGLELFEGKAMCSNCHIAEPDGEGRPPLFTDYTYDNLGVPRNPLLFWYLMPERFNPIGFEWLDLGLAFNPVVLEEFLGFLPNTLGKMKVPTLRNVDKRPWPGFIKSYMHNGFFKTLEGVVHFYNTRDVLQRCEDIPGIPELITEEVALAYDCWPDAEVPINVNVEEMGDLGLTPGEERALVAFMETLSDGYMEPQCDLDDGHLTSAFDLGN